ncbi:MAG TPA: Cna B-type domain-containing protein [Candidatus Mediterraneibacter surreyensis]|nr:Cna B-type domain-containing protein [Candidatus Mediterraneibacter stercoripullorum]HJB46693.1 Cna B-type domain-containing protein [Candidatus Mediterraneibacter surreyensis]
MGSDGQPGEKYSYDLDSGQSIADYTLIPSAIRTEGAFSNDDTVTTTVYVEDTLPKGLTYIPFSGYWGGNYTQNGEGKQGTVTGGVPAEPEIRENEDGTITLLWTLENVTITAEAVTRIDPIYYSCDIGNKDSVQNNQELMNTVKIWSEDEQLKDFAEVNGYTLDESLRGKTSKDLTKENFTDPASQWVELTVDQQRGNVTLPQGEFRPVAFAAVGSLPANQTLKMHVTINLPEGRAGEHAVNRLTNSTLESYGRSYVVGRTLEGVVWLDADKNGLRADSEEMKDGVTATLMLLKDGGDPSRAEDYEPYEVNGKAVSVATGQQINVITGTVSEYITVNYKFVNLPEGTFGVRFSDGTLQMADYETSPADEGDDDTIDSDARPSYTDGILTSALITGINMPSIEMIEGSVYASQYNDMGIYPAEKPEPVDVHVEKIWDDAGNQDGKRPADIQVQLYADGEKSGEPVTLNEGNGWSHTWRELDEKSDGKDIAYTVKEVGEDGGKITFSNGAEYGVAYGGSAESGYTVTNSYTPETIKISGSKTWDDADNQDGKRPESITIRLYANGEEAGGHVQTVTAADGWSWKFTDLPKFEDGEEIIYTISEDQVSGYQPEIDGYDITNSHTPVKTESTPETGDRGTPALWIVLMGLAGTAIVTGSYLAEKKRKTYRK